MSPLILPHEQTILERALTFALDAHAGQYDRAGFPFIFHPIRVSEKQTTIIRRVIALLHDTIEDTATTYEDIEDEFGTDIAKSVQRLSRGEDESYNTYMRRLIDSMDIDAMYVKKADIEDNTDVRRVDEKAAKRFPMYVQSHRSICNVLGIESHFESLS